MNDPNLDDLCAVLDQHTVVSAEHDGGGEGSSAATAAAGADHPRFSEQYKNEGRLAQQQRQRRQQHLERQNAAREEWLERRRNIDVDTSTTDDDSQVPNAFAPRKPAKKSTLNPYVGWLMFSDWLVDIPGTLSTEWTMVPSPVGRRALVVAKKGETSVYYKHGHLGTRFESKLPGGNMATKGSLTILDCILDRNKKKLYLLDLLWWNKQMYTDTEFSLRRFFLQSRIEELDIDSKGKSGGKNHELIVLPSCACSPDQIEQFMRTEFPYTLDGLLFYYSSAYYLPGQTPLVGWLKPWMLPEILGVPVPECYIKDVKHANTKEFIAEFNATHKHTSSAQKQQQAEAETVVVAEAEDKESAKAMEHEDQ